MTKIGGEKLRGIREVISRIPIENSVIVEGSTQLSFDPWSDLQEQLRLKWEKNTYARPPLPLDSDCTPNQLIDCVGIKSITRESRQMMQLFIDAPDISEGRKLLLASILAYDNELFSSPRFTHLDQSSFATEKLLRRLKEFDDVFIDKLLQMRGLGVSFNGIAKDAISGDIFDIRWGKYFTNGSVDALLQDENMRVAIGRIGAATDGINMKDIFERNGFLDVINSEPDMAYILPYVFLVVNHPATVLGLSNSLNEVPTKEAHSAYRVADLQYILSDENMLATFTNPDIFSLLERLNQQGIKFVLPTDNSEANKLTTEAIEKALSILDNQTGLRALQVIGSFDINLLEEYEAIGGEEETIDACRALRDIAKAEYLYWQNVVQIRRDDRLKATLLDERTTDIISSIERDENYTVLNLKNHYIESLRLSLDNLEHVDLLYTDNVVENLFSPSLVVKLKARFLLPADISELIYFAKNLPLVEQLFELGISGHVTVDTLRPLQEIDLDILKQVASIFGDEAFSNITLEQLAIFLDKIDTSTHRSFAHQTELYGKFREICDNEVSPEEKILFIEHIDTIADITQREDCMRILRHQGLFLEIRDENGEKVITSEPHQYVRQLAQLSEESYKTVHEIMTADTFALAYELFKTSLIDTLFAEKPEGGSYYDKFMFDKMMAAVEKLHKVGFIPSPQSRDAFLRVLSDPIQLREFEEVLQLNISDEAFSATNFDGLLKDGKLTRHGSAVITIVGASEDPRAALTSFIRKDPAKIAAGVWGGRSGSGIDDFSIAFPEPKGSTRSIPRRLFERYITATNSSNMAPKTQFFKDDIFASELSGSTVRLGQLTKEGREALLAYAIRRVERDTFRKTRREDAERINIQLVDNLSAHPLAERLSADDPEDRIVLTLTRINSVPGILQHGNLAGEFAIGAGLTEGGIGIYGGHIGQTDMFPFHVDASDLSQLKGKRSWDSTSVEKMIEASQSASSGPTAVYLLYDRDLFSVDRTGFSKAHLLAPIGISSDMIRGFIVHDDPSEIINLVIHDSIYRPVFNIKGELLLSPARYREERERLKATLVSKLENTTGEEIIASLSDLDSDLRHAYESDAHVVEGHTIGSHTARVLDNWLSAESFAGIPKEEVDIGIDIGVALAVHDIGKDEAHRLTGSTEKQGGYNAQSTKVVLRRHGFGEREIRVFAALINHDYIGSYVKGLSDLETTRRRLRHIALSISGKERFNDLDEESIQRTVKAAVAFYLCDASSYEGLERYFDTTIKSSITPTGHIAEKISALLRGFNII